MRRGRPSRRRRALGHEARRGALRPPGRGRTRGVGGRRRRPPQSCAVLTAGLAELREAVEAGLVHPDPHREPVGREPREVGRVEVGELLLRARRAGARCRAGRAARSSTRRRRARPAAAADPSPPSATSDDAARRSARPPRPRCRRAAGAVLGRPGAAAAARSRVPADDAAVVLEQPVDVVGDGDTAASAAGSPAPSSTRTGLRRRPAASCSRRSAIAAPAGKRSSPPVRTTSGSPARARPRPTRRTRARGELDVAGRVVRAPDDPRVIVRRARGVTELELLEADHRRSPARASPVRGRAADAAETRRRRRRRPSGSRCCTSRSPMRARTSARMSRLVSSIGANQPR